MGSFQDGLLDGLRRAYCQEVASKPDWWRFMRRLTGYPGFIRRATDSVIQWVCDRPPTPDDRPPPPFTGGQCPVDYRVRCSVLLTQTNGSTTPSTTGTYVLRGPITGVGSGPPNGACGSSTKPAAVVFHNGGATVVACAGPAASITATGFVLLERVDGQPDNCGDPLPELPPGLPPDIDVDVDVTYGDNNQYNLTIPVIFAPVYVSIDGRLNVPITLNLAPEFQVKGTLELFPNFSLDLDFPTANPEDGPGTRPDDEPKPQPPPNGDGESENPDDPEIPDEEPRVYALLVRARITDGARATGIFQEIGPDIYAPRLGSARFGTVIDGAVFWSEDIDIKGLDSVVDCPIPWGANRFVVNASEGVVLNYSPVLTEPKPWPPFLQLGTQYNSDNR